MVNNPHLDSITSDILGPTGSYWKKNKDYIVYNFALRLYQYSAGKMFDYSVHENTKILPSNFHQRKEITDKIRAVRRSSSQAKQFQRLLIGNYGMFETLTPSKCKLSSKEANKLKLTGNSKQSNFVADHIIGVTSIGELATEELKANYLNIKTDTDWSKVNYVQIQKAIEKMCNKWLPNHLWLWAMCRVTKEEHKSDRLKRGTDIEISDKKKLKHYNNANIIIEKYQ